MSREPAWVLTAPAEPVWMKERHEATQVEAFQPMRNPSTYFFTEKRKFSKKKMDVNQLIYYANLAGVWVTKDQFESYFMKFMACVDTTGGHQGLLPLSGVEPGLGPCWLWARSRNNSGYGVFPVRSKLRAAHRVSYSYKIGGLQIPEDLVICHRCDNPPCVRPGHLFAGTQKENMQDALRKGRLWMGTGKPLDRM